MDLEKNRAERIKFLTVAITAEGGLLLVALAAGWILGRPAWSNLDLSVGSLTAGVIATIPLLLLLTFIYQTRDRRLVEFRELIRDLLGKSLTTCGFLDLCAVALLAGVSEEFLFRGVLQPWLEGWGIIFGLIVCNIVFGLCHALTPTYFVFAMIVGVYLSLTLWCTNKPNLVVPISCHAFYDLAAFIVVRNSYRITESQISPSIDDQPPAKHAPNHPITPNDQ